MNKITESQTGIFTVCSICYLPKALVLANSLYHYENKKIIIYIVDKKCEINLNFEFAEFRWIEEENIPDLYKLAFMYDVSEFTTCLKPLITLRLLKSFSSVIFFDPDVCIFGNLEPIYKGLSEYPVLLTPHYTVPLSKDENFDLNMMRFGSFNLGFYAVTSQQEALAFLSWWSDCCVNLCFFETQFGLSTDQKWVSIAPCFFPNLHVMFDLGLNMAFWNLHERVLDKDEQGYLVNNKFRLVFFHFSAFDLKNPKSISSRSHKWQSTGRNDLNDICTTYAADLIHFDKEFSSIKYGFDFLNDGSYISPTLRRAYVAVKDELVDVVDPFRPDGKLAKFIRKNYLIEKNNLIYRSANTVDIKDHEGKFKVIYFALRFVLRILGPNKFFNLSRLFVYLSSYRQNRGLWKI